MLVPSFMAEVFFLGTPYMNAFIYKVFSLLLKLSQNF